MVPTSGCLGIANMGDLKARLGFDHPTAGPVASIAATPTAPQAGQVVRFDGSASTDPAGGGLLYQWDLGDGATATGSTVTHTFASQGVYPVTLVVEDAKGRQGSTTLNLVVAAAPQPPVASFTIADASGATVTTTEVGTTLHLDASASSSPEGSALTYRWNLGDGATATGVQATHAYASPGLFQVSLTVQDASGRNATSTRPVAVDLHLHRQGTMNVTDTNRSYAFLQAAGAGLDVVLSFNATGGLNDLNLALVDASGNVVARSAGATAPGNLGNATESLHLTPADLAGHAPGTWTVQVERARGANVAFSLALAETVQVPS